MMNPLCVLRVLCGVKKVFIMFDLRDLYQQVIVDHNKSPRNFGKLEFFNHEADGYNPLCGDRLHVYLNVNDEGLIEDVSFEGEGCAISVASASLMTDTLKGRPVSEFQQKFEGFQHMVTADLDRKICTHRKLAAGFALTIVLVPGGWARLLARLRQG